MRKLAALIATFFGVGRMPKAPGTFGTLAAVPFALALSFAGQPIYLAACAILLPLGSWAAQVYGKDQSTHDCQEIVIDEVLGFFLAVILLPMSQMTLLLGFLLFRFFDVLKPFPISFLDEKVKGGFGVMVDDVAAGLIVNVILQIVNSQTQWLQIGLFS